MPDLEKLALKLAADGPHKTLPTPRLIQLLYNGEYVARTTSALFVWEHPFYPQYYLPRTAFSDQHLTITNEIKDSQGTTIAHHATVTVNSKSTNEVLVFAKDLENTAAPIANHVRVEFSSMDQWFEESTPIQVHPKDPFKRIDILHSTRPISVKIRGIEVASTTSSMHLYETGLPVRFYMPLTCIRPEILRRSATRTKCPYKGEAEYWSVDLGDGKGVVEDVIWFYTNPTIESSKIQGLCCFYNEKVTIELDGQELEQPKTHFSKGPNAKPPSAV